MAIAFAFAFTIACQSPFATAALVQDGNFDTDTVNLDVPSSGVWALTNNTASFNFVTTGTGNISAGAQAGSNFYLFGEVLAGGAQLSQVGSLTSGHSYELSYYVSTTTDAQSSGGFLSASIDGHFQSTSASSLSAGHWTQEKIDFTASGNSATVAFTGFGSNGYVALDSITLTDQSVPPSGVPEPTSMASMALALAGMGFYRTRRKAGAASTTNS